jgi:aldose sugar dehydrogenase
MLITERSGDLWLVRDGQLVDEPVGGVPEVHAQGQGGFWILKFIPIMRRTDGST